MDFYLAQDLAVRLRDACPYRSGALRMSISRVQGTENEYVITIGNNQGKEVNGCCATVEYAAITNFNKLLYYKKKNGDIISYNNPNYHWVNKTVAEWVRANKLNFTIKEE